VNEDDVKVWIPGEGEMTTKEAERFLEDKIIWNKGKTTDPDSRNYDPRINIWNKIPEAKLIVVKCPNCGKKHKRVPSQAKRRYCSAECVILGGANVSELYAKRIPWWFFGVENIDYVVCKICGGYYRIINDAHLRTHNTNVGEYRKNYPDAIIICQNSSIKRSKISKEVGGPKGWKPSQEWIEKRRALMLTDANPVYHDGVSEKLSMRGKERHQNDEWVKSMIVSNRYLPAFGNSLESKKHNDMKEMYANIFENEGFEVILEFPLKVNNWYVVDVYVKDLKLIVECGGCKEGKIADLSTKYNVIHAPYDEQAYLVERCKK